MSWVSPPPRRDTLAGHVLDAFFAAVHEALPRYDSPLTIFGSAPIQLCLDEDFASADVDIMVLSESARLREIAKSAGLARSATLRPAYGVQICPPGLFKSTPHYLQRAHIEVRQGVRVIVPHLRDVLIGKLHRTRTDGQEGLVAKDHRAFSRVREMCQGHPDKGELIEDLVSCEPSFRVTCDGSINSFRLNVEDLLATHYGHRFDLERDILVPARRVSDAAQEDVSGAVEKMLRDLRPTRD
jgi:hypothetical protein